MAITGELKDFGLVTLIQINCIEKKSARLTINSKGKEAIIYFENGEIAHAQYADLTGTHAVHQALTLNDGYFRLEEGISPQVRTNKLPWMFVLMEGIRLLDERRVDEDKRPLEQRVVEDLTKLHGVDWVMAAAADGTVLAHSGLKTPERIGALVAFFSAKGHTIGTKLKLGRAQQLALVCADTQIALFYRENYIIAVLLDAGTNFEAFSDEVNGILRRHFSDRVLTA